GEIIVSGGAPRRKLTTINCAPLAGAGRARVAPRRKVLEQREWPVASSPRQRRANPRSWGKAAQSLLAPACSAPDTRPRSSQNLRRSGAGRGSLAGFARRLFKLAEGSARTIWFATVEAHCKLGSCSYSQ